MTPIQTIKQMQSTDILRMCLNSLCTSCMAYLVKGGQTVLIVEDRHARIKSKLWPSRTPLNRDCRKTVREEAVTNVVPTAASLLLSAF